MNDLPTQKKKPHPLTKLVLEMGPLMVFFFVNARGQKLMDSYEQLAIFGKPIFLATAVFMVAITISLVAGWILTRHLAIMPLVSGVVVMVFGGLTLFLHDDTFIKMKPTIINSLFGVVLLGGLYFGKSLLTYIFDEAFKLSDDGWRVLTWRWGLFFFFLAVVNEVVWRTQTTDFWVAFKVWGIMPITFLFTMLQMPFIMKHMEEE